jgi:quercetin dioxygenase-like cupin family protein
MRLTSITLAMILVGCADQPTATVKSTLVAPPKEAKGGSTKSLGSIDLAPEVQLPGYQLRARAVTIEPGGYLAAHTHQGRPTMEYVAQGTVIEVRNGVATEHKAGTMVPAMNGVTHWWENHGTVPVVLVPVDIAKP